MNDPLIRDDETAGLLRQAVGALSRRLRETGKAQGRPDGRHPDDGRPEGGVSLTGLSVLVRLHQAGARTPSALAADEHMQPQSLTRVLAVLEEKGLIERHGDPDDRRQVLVRLTDGGASLLRDEARRREAWLRGALAALSPTERELLRLAAGLMLEMARDMGKDSGSDLTGRPRNQDPTKAT